jgi:predicted RNA-binding Zn ribbon-like protein
MNDRELVESWSLVAGHLALDFVNTVGGTPTTARHDLLSSYESLLVWSGRAGTVESAQAERLRLRARRRREEAQQVVERARALRSSMYAAFDELRVGGAVAAPWQQVRPVVAEAMAVAEPQTAGPRLAWSWQDCTELVAPLYPVAVGAAELVTSDRVELLVRCGRCRWLFLDQSRNHARRWCDMSTCGIAEKIERQAERRRARRAAG